MKDVFLLTVSMLLAISGLFTKQQEHILYAIYLLMFMKL